MKGMYFDEEIIKGIEKLICTIKRENGIVNEIIRDDVFSILQDCNCNVLYYPLEGEEIDGCDGCHLEKPVNGHMEQFVFINTNNTRERQAFSAAHELGHIWKVDERIREMYPEKQIDTESVINRFAAELLMPTKYFQDEVQNYLQTQKYQGPQMDVGMMVGMIAYLMNYFFVPFKAVVIRFNELNRLDEKYNRIILAYKDSRLLQEIIKAEQYTRLGIVNKLKSMDNLQEYLMEAEKKQLISQQKIDNIRRDFEIQTVHLSENKKIDF